MSSKQILTTIGTAVTLILVITLAVSFSGTGTTQNQPGSQNAQTAAHAPGFSLKNYSNEIITLDDFDTPITVINLWASWCPFCTDELPDFAELQETYPDQIEVVAINRGEDREAAKSFTDQRGITDDMTFLLDPDESYYKKIGGFAMPETLFLGPNKNIVRHHRGPLSLQDMKDIVDKQLSVPNESVSRGDSYGCSGGQCQTTSSPSTDHGN